MGVNTELFSVQVREEGVFLVVTAPSDGAPAIEMGQVLDYLAAQQIVEYNRLAVEEAVRAHSSSPVKIADSQKAKPEAQISVIVARDRMEAFLQIDLPNGAIKPDVETVRHQIEKAGVSTGILEESVQSALRQPGIRTICAKGCLPENGTDARIET